VEDFKVEARLSQLEKAEAETADPCTRQGNTIQTEPKGHAPKKLQITYLRDSHLRIFTTVPTDIISHDIKFRPLPTL